MLDPEYEHIVLVHYREVDEGRYVSGSTSNFSIESYSNLNHTSTIINSDRGYMSGTTALYEPSQSSYSPGSTEDVNSKFVLENFDVNHYNKFERLENSDKNSQPEVNRVLQNLEAQLNLDDDDNSIYLKENLLEYPCENDDIQVLEGFPNGGTVVSLAHENLLQGSDTGHRVNEVRKQQNYATVQLPKISGDHESQQNQPLCLDSPSWTDVLQLSSKSARMESHGRSSDFLACNGIPDYSISSDMLPTFSGRQNMSIYSFGASENLSSCTAEDKPNGHEISESDLHLQLSATRRFLLGSKDSIESPSAISQLKMFGEHHSFAEDTFEANGRKVTSSGWIETIPIALENNTNSADFSSIFCHSQFGASLATDLSSQKRRFSICEVSPEWAFSYDSTKVIITGEFLCDPLESSWAVMFGDIEVPLEIVQEGVLRCQAPQHSTGKVTLCITSGNRESCSEVREFEFRAKLTTSSYIDHLSIAGTAKDSEEILLLARLSQMLLCEYDNSTIEKGPMDNQVGKSRKLKATDEHWKKIIETLKIGCDNSLDTKDWIMQELLKDKLLNWLSMKHQNNKQADCLLSKQEHGIIHLISGLGYEWALNLILEHGVGINFRDENGWTALHWAAYCGREKMVAALLAAGASAELVTDPTAQDPVGKTPGFLASARGHTGLAGYLSEVALTSHLSSLTIEESEICEGSSEVEAERAVESISSVIKHGGNEDELSMKDSLAAVRNATLAAARIQAAFRAHSFRKRQQKTALSLSCDDYGMTPGDIRGLSAVSRVPRPSYSSQDQNFDRAALSIQKKYRGWKGRRDFLTLRQHVVKIQAHVRGHQVRKKYREILWTVSVVEKAILRWRRKGAGLRGFRAEPEMTDEDDDDDDDIAKIFRRQKVDGAVDEAVSRVLSMVDSPDARQQYRRMLERYHKAKAELSNSDEAASGYEDDSELVDIDFID
ncbi:calmodulin-binding transcription activator 4-like isoform X2 [Curcuma longa]